jgi:beta-lactamase class D
MMTRTTPNMIEDGSIASVDPLDGFIPCTDTGAASRSFLCFVTVCAAWMILGWATHGCCEDPDLAKLFADRKVEGTIVLSASDGSLTYLHNEGRAHTRFVPASTFKIINTLIALDGGALADDKEIIKWDGNDKGLETWNRDHALETAFKSSCIWFYQELARRIGTAKYAAHLERAGYGTATPGPELTTFWLEGDLKTSAVDQIDFLKKVYRRELAFRPSSYDILTKIMIVDQTPARTVRAKTGWAQTLSPQIGWFVGYVESGDKAWFFATNLEITKPEQARYRQEITMEALKLKGLL